jgi:anti-anti-sigma factor
MPDELHIPPFFASVADTALTFRFDRESFEQGHEFPPNLEALITNAVRGEVDRVSGRRVCIDLEDLPAISSKQLGAMLAVRKACRSDQKVRVLRLRPNVRDLLHITKLGDFFEWDEPSAAPGA